MQKGKAERAGLLSQLLFSGTPFFAPKHKSKCSRHRALSPFLGEGSPTKIDHSKKSTLILTSLLDNLGYVPQIVNMSLECQTGPNFGTPSGAEQSAGHQLLRDLWGLERRAHEKHSAECDRSESTRISLLGSKAPRCLSCCSFVCFFVCFFASVGFKRDLPQLDIWIFFRGLEQMEEQDRFPFQTARKRTP